MEKNSHTQALLNEIHRNVTTGSETLCCMIPHIKDRFLMREVTSDMNRYNEYAAQTGELMKRHGLRANPLTAGEKGKVRLGVMLDTLFDTSDPHLAAVIAKGTRLGADSLETLLCSPNGSGADRESLALARAVVEFERKESEKLKDFI